MKSKNLVIASMVLVFAMGSGFVSVNMLPTNAWIKARPTQGADIQCLQVGECDQQGQNPCKIKVFETLTGAPAIAQKAYNSSTNCTVQLTDSRTFDDATMTSVYEVIEK